MDTEDVKVVFALGKAGGFGVGRGNVLAGLPPEDFLATGGGPAELCRVSLTCSVDLVLDPWKPFEDVRELVDPILEEEPLQDDLGEVLRLLTDGLDRRLDFGTVVAAFAVGSLSRGVITETVLGGDDLCSREGDTLLFTAACKILRFSSLTILSLSSLHCLSLACLSRS